MNRTRLYLLLLSSVATGAGAQVTEPISAERPGFSLSPIALQAGDIQIETGYEYLRDDAAVDFESHTLPLMLVRVGLTERVELQVAWPGYSWAKTGSVDIDGRSDASVGAKWQLTSEEAAVPLALFAGVTLPIGSTEFTTDEVDPVLGAFWSYGGRLNWFGTVILTESDDETIVTNAVGISLPLGARTGSYIEYFGDYVSGNGPEHYLNGGFTWHPRLNLQLDVQLGVGLNDRAADVFAGFGLAYRY